MQRTLRTIAVASVTSIALLAGSANAAMPEVDYRPPPAGDEVRVATLNVLKVLYVDGKRSWAKRRIRMKHLVAETKPDVLMVQEANTKKWRDTRHIYDVRNRMASLGYEITSTRYNDCTSYCTRGAHIFYNPERMTLVEPPNGPAAGMLGISQIGKVKFGSVQDRNAAWAFLKPVGSSQVAFYMSVHLPTAKTTHSESLRVAVADKLRPWAEAKIAAAGMEDVEIVIGGDLNSHFKRQPLGAQYELAKDGLIDAWTAPKKKNKHYGTINKTPKTAQYLGFPPRPHYYKDEPTRIDYVFSTVPASRHEVVVHLRDSGRFRKYFKASDHNMVLVDLPLK